MTDAFSRLYDKESVKRDVREAIEMIAREALLNTDADLVARRLINAAFDLASDIKAKRGGGSWMSAGLESLRRLRDGRLRTKEDLLREIADRNLNSGTRPIP